MKLAISTILDREQDELDDIVKELLLLWRDCTVSVEQIQKDWL